MPDWGEIFSDVEMQRLDPNPEVLALLPVWRGAGCRRVLDAGCGVGRHLMPLAEAGFEVWGIDSEAGVLGLLETRLGRGNPAPMAAGTPINLYPLPVHLLRADLRRLPLVERAFDLVLSINVINHGDARAFRDYCRELGRVLRPGGHVFINVSPLEFGKRVLLPQSRELEPGTWVDIATPDGNLVHHFPTPEELAEQFPGYRRRRLETRLTPIPFMGGVELPQLIFWAEKG